MDVTTDLEAGFPAELVARGGGEMVTASIPIEGLLSTGCDDG